MADDVVPSPRPLPDVIGGRYRIVSRLGVGGMGVVYKAIDLQLNRSVAVKALEDRRLLLPGASSRLRAEALAAASLDHPYVCKVYELAETSSETFMIMEFVEGETLSAVLKRGVPPLLQTLQIAREIVEGLAAAHARGLVHRDVKPANVMVMPNGHIKLLDFGVAGVEMETTPADDTRTHLPMATRLHAGTPHYMAPEQAAGQPITTRADLFSFGVLLYECLTGSLPFSGSTTFDYVRHVMQSAPKRLDRVAPDTPAVLVDLVERCLEKTPADRPESAGEIDRQLRALTDTLTSPGAAIRTAGQMRSGRRWKIVAAAAAVLAVAAAAWQFLAPGATAEPLPQYRPFVTTSAVESGSQISPDGGWISFISTAGGVSRIMVQRVDGGEARPLTLGQGQPISQVWSPDGNQIAAVLMIDDQQVLQIYPAFFGGAPLQSVALDPKAERLQRPELIRWIGRDVYYRVTPRSGPTLSLRRLSLDAPSQVTSVDAGWKLDGALRSLDVRPDGLAAVVCISKDGQEDLWTLNLDGSGLRQLTSDAFFDRNPRWIGTGDRVAFQSNRGGQVDLWRIDVRTKSLLLLVAGEAEELVESSSPDGKLISYQALTKDSNLWTFGNGAPQQLTQDSLSDYSPVLSGDGRVIAFQRSQQAPSRGYTILDAKLFYSPLANGAVVDARPIADGFAADLSGDGQWLAYMHTSDVPVRHALSVRDLRGGATTNVTRKAGLPSLTLAPVDWGTRLTAWSRSGVDLFFVDVDEASRYTLRRYRTGTPAPGPPLVTAPAELTEVTMRDLHVSPQTGRLAYILSFRGGDTRLFELDPESGSTREIAGFSRDRFGAGLIGRGWLDRRFVLTRSIHSNDDFTSELEVLLVDERGAVRVAGRIPRAFTSTIRLDASRRVLYTAGAEQGTHNVYAFSLETGALTALTDNRLPGVSFSGFAPAGAKGVIGVREDRRDDIWLIQYPSTQPPGNKAGR